MAIQSYKYKSKAATAITFIATYILYLGQDGLNEVLPKELLFIVPFLVYLAGYFVTQTTEDKRVAVAEDIKEEEFKNRNVIDLDDIDESEEEKSYDSSDGV